MTENPSLSALLARIDPITLDEMESITLMNRIDSKYLTDFPTLLRLLGDAAEQGYRALYVDGKKLIPYDSVYFDTPDLKTYTDHRNRKLVRQKVRTRCYLTDSGAAFLEIKRKTNHGRTKKKRMQIPMADFADFRGNAEAAEYLKNRSMFTAEQLSPELHTRFSRITLVNAHQTERITIDMDLRFENVRHGTQASLPGAVVIELKQDGRAPSRMKPILLKHRIKPFRISKYCTAVTLTDPTARYGRFKLKLKRIGRVIGCPLYPAGSPLNGANTTSRSTKPIHPHPTN